MMQFATVAPYIVFGSLLIYFLLLWIKPLAVARFHAALPAPLRSDIDVRLTRIAGVCGMVIVILFAAAWAAR